VSASRPKNGFVLIATSIALMILLALAGLAVDVGRMYVIKSELQAFADAAALSAAACLDGSGPGLAKARQAPRELTTGPNAMKWDLGTQPIAEFTSTFAQGDTTPDTKTWQAEPKDAGSYRFVRVVATVPAPLIFLRPFQALHADFMTVAVASIAANSPTGARLVQ
jgi:uncharacterized membrane protein